MSADRLRDGSILLSNKRTANEQTWGLQGTDRTDFPGTDERAESVNKITHGFTWKHFQSCIVSSAPILATTEPSGDMESPNTRAV